jgi:hypothetical protein
MADRSEHKLFHLSLSDAANTLVSLRRGDALLFYYYNTLAMQQWLGRLLSALSTDMPWVRRDSALEVMPCIELRIRWQPE